MNNEVEIWVAIIKADIKHIEETGWSTFEIPEGEKENGESTNKNS